MKTLGQLFGLLFLVGSFAGAVQAQTLTEKLLQEDPTKLVADARENGQIVRGAILFHQGNINCAKCHRSTAEQDRLGPDLSRIDAQATDEYLVESLLEPSKQIKKGFETVVVATLDGRVISGMVVRDDDQALVIRDRENPDNVITIPRSDVDEMRPGELSNMPANLADQLKDRQQFLDLLRYVLDVRERGADGAATTSAVASRRELSPELEGMVLIHERNCVACHTIDSVGSPIASKLAPKLSWSAKHLNPRYLESFILDPHGIKLGTTMPKLALGDDPMQRQEVAQAIVHYLTRIAGNDYQPQDVEAAAVKSGQALFHSVGCVACHAPRDAQAIEKEFADSIPLGALSGKYNVEGLVSFLENPLAVRSSGHMPNMQLEHREAIDIASYLLQSREADQEPWQIDNALADKGKTHFAENRCIHCHTDVMENSTKPVAEISMAEADLNKGCLSEAGGHWPDWHLSASQREQIRAALRAPRSPLSDAQKIDVTLRAFNCIACHSRNDLGGVSSARNTHFQTTNLNLGDQGRIPPTLTGVGAKLEARWLRDVLVNRRSIRPYMLTRMPQFGEENIGHLMPLFEATDHLAETQFATFADSKEARKQGLELAGNRGLNCVACHTYKFKTSDTMPAVDLTEMAERLKKDWFYQYMLSPQKFSPNTVMPSFWPGGKAIRKDIEGTPEEQIEKLWQYLLDGRQANAPSGVIQEPLILVVAEEARMLRRKYPEIGKRGIGVGYPGDVNLAFDAEQLRLASLWQGEFVDAVGVWTGQGSGNVRPLGSVIAFARGPDLDDRTAPWAVDEERPPKHRFRGYSLDAQQRPTFRYTFEDVDVRDYCMERIEGDLPAGRLHRTIVLTAPRARPGLRFRVGSATDIARIDEVTFGLGTRLKVRFGSDVTAAVVDDTEGKRLELQFDLQAEAPLQIEWDYIWNTEE